MLANVLILIWLVFLFVTSPIWLLFLFVRLIATWIVMPHHGKDVLVVTKGEGNYGPWLSQLLRQIEPRALLLDYSQRENWKASALTVRLFRAYGPKVKAEVFMPHYLPAIIVFRRFHLPRNFSFGDSCKDPETRLAEVRAIARLSQ